MGKGIIIIVHNKKNDINKWSFNKQVKIQT